MSELFFSFYQLTQNTTQHVLPDCCKHYVQTMFQNPGFKFFALFFLLLRLGGVHKLRLQNLAFFDRLPPSVYIF